MPVDYAAIRAENRRKYGEEIGRIGRMLLADRYDDRTHFIFEILQNTEDALKKRGEWQGRRAVEFSLSSNHLAISHFGKPFDEADVRGICGIGESTKRLTDIGRFGIGFKSVYAFTDAPEIHSGQEHFAIESYVWPKNIGEITLQPEETRIRIPFRAKMPGAKNEITKGLRRLDLRSLLFLRQIEEVSWTVVDGPSGQYLREKLEKIGNGARRVVLTGQNDARDDTEEWLVFAREVFNEGVSAGHVEVAFSLSHEGVDGQRASVASIVNSPLVAFFPTVLSTNLGFLIQGPYRTTPSRDNVPESDRWNRHLVEETALLLIDALRGLRDLGLLDVSAIQCLPLDERHFADGSRLAPLFVATREALRNEPLLPTHDGIHVPGKNAKLARSQELRDLVRDEQLTSLFPANDKSRWLSDEITSFRTPVLDRYLTGTLDVEAVTPEGLISELTPEFLEAQPDDWIERLYRFLSTQRALIRRLRGKPMVRLEDGSHIPAFDGDGTLQAYLPSDVPTGFPTVRRTVCQSDEAKAFLESLGVRIPHPVDDVITNILPKYGGVSITVAVHEYEADIKRLLAAFDTDSTSRRKDLVSALQESQFVVAVDAGTRRSLFARPSEAYMATDMLTKLFEGVPGVLLVDNSRNCLRGERIRTLLRAVGTPEYLIRRRVRASLTDEDKRELRRREGTTDITSETSVEDHTLRGLNSLFSLLSELPHDQASDRASLLWEALREVQKRNGDHAFSGRYSWFRFTQRHMAFPAHFVNTLNETAWVPSKSGALQPPSSVVFADTGWEEDSALGAKIRFKPDVLNRLAEEAGVEPGVLALIKRRGITLAQMTALLGETDSAADGGDTPKAESKTTAIAPERPKITRDRETDDDRPSGPSADTLTAASDTAAHLGDASIPDGSTLNRKFISYVEVSPKERSQDTDGLIHKGHMDLEEKAIALILSEEPGLKRTPVNNPGFDLTELGPDSKTIRWIEVKAMTSTLGEHPVTLTRRQFEFAQERGDSYWLYVVENVSSPSRSRILKIRDPAGKAQMFSFDRGWVEVSENLN